MVKRIALMLLTCAAPLMAHAQTVQTSLSVNYGSAYRNGHWVPVDVFATNNGPGIEGELVITTRDAVGNAQSPVHRVPIDLPTNSSKRFRVTCRLENADKIEARLFHRGREIKEIGMQVTVPPIRANDLLGLILDERPEDYAFLSDLYLGETAPRFYRESLPGEAVAALSDNPRCYDSFDVIILGDTDPARLTGPQRNALVSFVSGGGTLVALTGAQSAAYRGSWVEELARVAIGDTQYVPASEFAVGSLGETKGAGAPADVSASIAGLVPSDSTVQRLGGAQTLATRTKIGRGAVILLANDQKTQALEKCSGYVDLWRSIAQRRGGDPDLNWPAATRFLGAAMPAMAGVQMLPRSSVLTYLVVYFVVGVVLNWAFWTWRKRREMAWVCLIFFSGAFTAYAMLYGTAGRATESQMFQFDLVSVQGQTGAARVDSVLGVVSSGSSRYAAELPLPASLLTDLSATHGAVDFDPFDPRGRRTDIRPVSVVDGDAPRLEDMRIGASDSRLLQVTSDATLEGGFEGTVSVSDQEVSCRIKNNTGQVLNQARLLLDGRWYPLHVEKDGYISANYSGGKEQASSRNDVVNNFGLNRGYDDMEYMFLYGDGGERRPLPKAGEVAVRLLEKLFSRQVATNRVVPISEEGVARRYSLPLLVVTTDRAVNPAILSEGIALKGGTSILLSTLPMIDTRAERPTNNTLPLVLENAQMQYSQGYGTPYWPGGWRDGGNEGVKYSKWMEEIAYLTTEEAATFTVHFDEANPNAPVTGFLIDTYAMEQDGFNVVVARAESADGAETEYAGSKVETLAFAGFSVVHRRHQIPLTSPIVAAPGTREVMKLRLKRDPGRDDRDFQSIPCSVECSVKYDEAAATKQEPIAWQ